jgi:hypothetical protein
MHVMQLFIYFCMHYGSEYMHFCVCVYLCVCTLSCILHVIHAGMYMCM